MEAARLEALAAELARNRAAGTTSHLSLAGIRDAAEAVAIQAAATSAYAPDVLGYTVVGTHGVVRRSLGLAEPIFGTIPLGTYLVGDRHRFRLPQGVIGAQCELVFTFGPLPPVREAKFDRDTIEKAVLSCQPGIGLLGRRTSVLPVSGLGAVADDAFHVATICGPASGRAGLADLAQIVVRASIDGNDVATTSAGAIGGQPFDAVAWLAARLWTDGTCLDPGDIVATGSCTPVLQVLPGQRLDVDFGAIGRVSCTFE